jgi:hypothetical protein
LSYKISRFIIWENFEIQNAFGNSFYNVPYQKKTLGQMQIALPVCLKQTRRRKPTNLIKNATKYSIWKRLWITLYKKKEKLNKTHETRKQ